MYPVALHLATTTTAALTRSAMPDAPVVEDPAPTPPTGRWTPGPRSAHRALLRLLAVLTRPATRRQAPA